MMMSSDHHWSLSGLCCCRPALALTESALTTTPALYLWSLPQMHCGKTRGKGNYFYNFYNERWKQWFILFYLQSIYQLLYWNILKIIYFFCMFLVFLLCTALALWLALHLNIPPPPPTWDNFLSNIPSHHLSCLESLPPPRHKIIPNYPSLHNLGILITSLHDLLHCYLDHPSSHVTWMSMMQMRQYLDYSYII